MANSIVTLLYDDKYLPGALTFAIAIHKLFIEFPPSAPVQLSIIIDESSLTAYQLDLVRELYDNLIPINLIQSSNPNLALINRPELNKTFSKIQLWNIDFDKVVYMDVDTLPLFKTISVLNLFNLDFQPNEIVAAPDIGFPDIFNSGLMVLHPNPETYAALSAAALNGSSFDGADQGLLNEYFNPKPDWLANSISIAGSTDDDTVDAKSASIQSDWIKLPFFYNVTPSTNYQYLPAFNHFESDIKLLHFIGSVKPWKLEAADKDISASISSMYNLWWDTFNEYFQLDVGYGHNFSRFYQFLFWEKGLTFDELSFSYSLKYDELKWSSQDRKQKFIDRLRYKEPEPQPIIEKEATNEADEDVAPEYTDPPKYEGPDPSVLCDPQTYENYPTIEPVNVWDPSSQHPPSDKPTNTDFSLEKFENSWDKQVVSQPEHHEEHHYQVHSYEHDYRHDQGHHDHDAYHGVVDYGVHSEVVPERVWNESPNAEQRLKDHESREEHEEPVYIPEPVFHEEVPAPMFPWEFRTDRSPAERVFNDLFEPNIQSKIWEELINHRDAVKDADVQEEEKEEAADDTEEQKLEEIEQFDELEEEEIEEEQAAVKSQDQSISEDPLMAFFEDDLGIPRSTAQPKNIDISTESNPYALPPLTPDVEQFKQFGNFKAVDVGEEEDEPDL